LERPIHQSDAWTIGWRAYGQTGSVTASVTCFDRLVAFAPGTPQNRSGCLEPSADVATLRYAGLELGVGQSPDVRAVALRVWTAPAGRPRQREGAADIPSALTRVEAPRRYFR